MAGSTGSLGWRSVTERYGGRVSGQNRLARETSPYLRQHADNPVDWYPWGDEAFAAARERDVPVLLSVGYSSCHWCHVMAHESFEDDDIAAEMNRRFVNIKVDREERPDIDAVYMEATQAMTGSGGWPMTVFMTPDGRAVLLRHLLPAGAPGRAPVVPRDHERGVTRRGPTGARTCSTRPTASPRRSVATWRQAGADLPTTETLDEATMSMLSSFDQQWGGFGRAPKFPQSMSLGHLLRHHHRTGSAAALEAVVTSLDAMAAGGMYDHIGGGFSRYSVDEQWLVPHFEKMLYDNALLARAVRPRRDRHRRGAVRAGGRRDLRVRHSATSPTPTAGATPPRTPTASPPSGPTMPRRARSTSGHRPRSRRPWPTRASGPRAEAACDWYGIVDGGNFEGASIPNRIPARGRARPITRDRTAARAALADARAKRPRPGLDDKVLTEWNAYFVTAAAEAGAALGRPDWIGRGVQTAEFLLGNLVRDDGRWLRSWQADGGAPAPGVRGRPRRPGRGVPRAPRRHRRGPLARPRRRRPPTRSWTCSGIPTVRSSPPATMRRRSSPAPRRSWTTPRHRGPAWRPPAFLRLEALTGESRFGEHARTLLRSLGPLIGRHALAFGNLAWAAAMHAEGVTEIVVSGDRPDLVDAVHRQFLPTSVLAWGEPFDGPLWEGRTESGEDGRAYVCRDFACAAPADHAVRSSCERLTRSS